MDNNDISVILHHPGGDIETHTAKRIVKRIKDKALQDYALARLQSGLNITLSDGDIKVTVEPLINSKMQQ